MAVALWLLVVGAASGVAWFAIDRAGREVLTSPVGGRVPAGQVATSAPTRAATGPTPTSDDHGEDSPAPTATSSPSRAPVVPPSGSGDRLHPPSRTTTSTTRPPTPPPSSPPGPAAVDRSVRVQGGQVGVRCVGRTISLRYATPSDGWRVEVDDQGPEHVKVRFSATGRDEQQSEIEAECEHSTPVFSTGVDDGDTERR
jgi:hypothetical protein